MPGTKPQEKRNMPFSASVQVPRVEKLEHEEAMRANLRPGLEPKSIGALSCLPTMLPKVIFPPNFTLDGRNHQTGHAALTSDTSEDLQHSTANNDELNSHNTQHTGVTKNKLCFNSLAPNTNGPTGVSRCGVLSLL
jgi:hypothetical protein